jgi:hypothetical protein
VIGLSELIRPGRNSWMSWLSVPPYQLLLVPLVAHQATFDAGGTATPTSPRIGKTPSKRVPTSLRTWPPTAR